MHLYQLHPSDPYASKGIATLFWRCGGRIPIRVRNFWRSGVTSYVKSGGETIFVCAIFDGFMAGASMCKISRKSDKAYCSTTIVDRDYQNKGVGGIVLGAKLEILRSSYPDHYLGTFVGSLNKFALKMCLNNGLRVAEKRERERPGKDANVFYELTSRPAQE